VDTNQTFIKSNWVFSFSIVFLVFGVLVVWMLFAPTEYANIITKDIQLHDDEGIYQVNNQMDVLVDENGQWTIDDVQSPDVSRLFQPALGKSSFGLTKGTYWIRTSIINESSSEQWVIRLKNSVVQQLDLHLVDGQAGAMQRFNMIEKVEEHFPAFHIKLTLDKEVTVYIRTEIDGSMIIPIELMDNQSYVNKLKNEYIFFGIFYGFVLLMAAYMFSLYIFVRMPSYLFYTLYIVCYSISQLVWNGLLQELLGADSKLLSIALRIFSNYEGIDFFFFSASLWFMLLFLGSILQLRIYAPRMQFIYRILNILAPLLLISLLFQIPGYAVLSLVYNTVFAIVIIISTIWTVYRGNLAARYLILAAIPFVGLSTPTTLNTFSLMQESFLTHYGFQLGSIAEYIMFAIALSYQIRQTREDKDDALRQIEMNERIQQTRNELLQNISHDIRSPLTVVQGGIQAMIYGINVEPEGKEKHLKSIYDKVLYINTFIDELVSISQDKQPDMAPSLEAPRVETVYFADWIKHEFDSLGSTIELAKLTSKCSITADPFAMVTLNTHEIRRVLSNLVNNACKFSKEGSSIFLHASSNNGHILVCVEDEGEGIAPEHLLSIFDRTYRVDPSSPTSGSGLGLSICKEIVERHHGSIWADSQVGFGSLFYVKIPLDKDEA
jgi:signal transduction histidine kinase